MGKARPWLEALVGKARVKDMASRIIGPTELIGRECQVLIEINDAGYPRVKSVLPRDQSHPRHDPEPGPR